MMKSLVMRRKQMIDIKFEDLNAWLEKYDSNAEIDVLLDLINKKIKIECFRYVFKT